MGYSLSRVPMVRFVIIASFPSNSLNGLRLHRRYTLRDPQKGLGLRLRGKGTRPWRPRIARDDRMECRHHHACSRARWGLSILGLLVLSVAGATAYSLPKAWGDWPGGSPPIVRQEGRFQQAPAPLPQRGRIRRLPPVTDSAVAPGGSSEAGSVESTRRFSAVQSGYRVELVSATAPQQTDLQRRLAGQQIRWPESAAEEGAVESLGNPPQPPLGDEPWHAAAQRAATSPQATWPLPPGTSFQAVAAPIEPGPGPEALSRPLPFEPGPPPEVIRRPDSLELIPRTEAIEPILGPEPIPWAPESADYHQNMPAGRWRPRFRPLKFLSPLARALGTHRGPCGPGIGYERVATAPFVIDIAQPMNHFALRADVAHGWDLPDRAEALLARPSSSGLGGRGPALAEQSVNFQDLAFVAEMGGPAFSVRTLIPLRLIDPEINTDTAGLGDIQTSTKTRLLDGNSWTITQVNNVYIQSGNAAKGLGTGHTSMEMGVLAGYKWTDETCLHGEAKFLVPMGGHPSHQGNIFRWGLGLSHLWYDSDSFALIPTLETVFYSILDGEATTISGGVPTVHRVDGETISTVHYGLRIVSDHGSDFGLVELGLSGGFNLGSDGWYDTLLRMELRTMY